jgi:hypothetical protein
VMRLQICDEVAMLSLWHSGDILSFRANGNEAQLEWRPY